MKKLIILLLLIAAIGCTKKYTKPSETAVTPEKPVKEEVIKPGKAEEAREVEEEIVKEELMPGEEKTVESAILTEEEAKSVFKDVLFDYNKYDIRPDAREVLNSIAAFLNNKREVNIVIEGHCDERGTNEYNLALGENRAKASREYLVSLGVSPDRMIVITFGEEKPVCIEQSESCWQKNRRAHFVIVKSRFQ